MGSEESLKELMDVTENMYVAAMQSEWDELDQLQQCQTSLLQSCSISSLQENASLVQRISDVTKQVVELAECHKQEIAVQLLEFKKNSNAQNAYLQNSK